MWGEGWVSDCGGDDVRGRYRVGERVEVPN